MAQASGSQFFLPASHPLQKYVDKTVIIQCRHSDGSLCHGGGTVRCELKYCQNCVFVVRQGLARLSAFSFEAVTQPGSYLAVSSRGTVELLRFGGTAGEASCCTFDVTWRASESPGVEVEVASLHGGMPLCLKPGSLVSVGPSANAKAPGTDLRIIDATVTATILHQ